VLRRTWSISGAKRWYSAAADCVMALLEYIVAIERIKKIKQLTNSFYLACQRGNNPGMMI
jgi:hypothetical protein